MDCQSGKSDGTGPFPAEHFGCLHRGNYLFGHCVRRCIHVPEPLLERQRIIGEVSGLPLPADLSVSSHYILPAKPVADELPFEVFRDQCINSGQVLDKQLLAALESSSRTS